MTDVIYFFRCRICQALTKWNTLTTTPEQCHLCGRFYTMVRDRRAEREYAEGITSS